jgi:hypothetical protein
LKFTVFVEKHKSIILVLYVLVKGRDHPARLYVGPNRPLDKPG